MSRVTALRVNGYESESTVPFGAVQRLSLPLRHHLGELPVRQQQALQVACGTADGPPPNRFLVGLGMLSLWRRRPAEQPIVCAVDDAHLVDPESLDALAFVARRIASNASPCCSPRETRAASLTGWRVWPAVARAAWTPIRDRTAPPLVAERIDPAAASAIVRATGGNPLALIDLTRDLSAAELGKLAIAIDPIPVGAI